MNEHEPYDDDDDDNDEDDDYCDPYVIPGKYIVPLLNSDSTNPYS